jgi:hypothetical protein
MLSSNLRDHDRARQVSQGRASRAGRLRDGVMSDKAAEFVAIMVGIITMAVMMIGIVYFMDIINILWNGIFTVLLLLLKVFS